MMRALAAQRYSGWVGWGLPLACVLALTLLLTHQALMVIEHHAGVMVGRGTAVTEPLAAGKSTAGGTHGEAFGGTHDSGAPRSVLGDCPAQQAVLPILLLSALLLVLLGAFRAGTARMQTAGAPHPAEGFPWSLAPPPARRRALLQVFLN